MPVPIELGSYDFVPETKVCFTTLSPSGSDFLLRVYTGKPRLGRFHHHRPEPLWHPRGKEAAGADPGEGCPGRWLLLREELQHIARARQPPVRDRQAVVRDSS